MRNKLIKYVIARGVKDRHDAETIVNDILMDDKVKGYEFRKAKLRVADYLNPERRKKEVEIALHLDSPPLYSESETSNYELIAYDNTNEKQNRLQANQRELIMQLTNGSDERTTLIVQTFLESDKPTVTNVAKRLGLDHKQVSRALTRLSRNYDEGLFGSLNDYFVA